MSLASNIRESRMAPDADGERMSCLNQCQATMTGLVKTLAKTPAGAPTRGSQPTGVAFPPS
jgi:hypothetical protein